MLYFLRNEFLESEIKLNFSFDFAEGSEGEAEATAEICFNDSPELTRSEITELIDFALTIQDKQWFEGLTSKYKQLSV